MREKVKNFIVGFMERLATEKHIPMPDCSDSLSLLESGVIESMDLVELLCALESEFSIKIDFDTENMEDYFTLGGMIDSVCRKLS